MDITTIHMRMLNTRKWDVKGGHLSKEQSSRLVLLAILNRLQLL
jgi:hypothetical protein